MDWEETWKKRLSRGTEDMFPRGEAPLTLIFADQLFVELMVEYGFRTVLCAGNGISQEPHALAEAGFNVSALDLSPTATRVAETHVIDEWDFLAFCPPEARRPGGHVDFILKERRKVLVCG